MHAALIAEAKPWTYWISFVLVASVVVAILGTLVGYLIKASSGRYPRR